MDRSYVTVHVGRDTRDRIRERTDPGESVEDWVRDAVHHRLDREGGEAGDEIERDAGDGRGGDDGDAIPRQDEPDYEFVDDCGV